MSDSDEEISHSAEEEAVTIQRGFDPSQMVRCDECLRSNPPTRTTCLYCAAPLPETESSAALRRPTLRRLERWERGFNVILLTDDQIDLQEKALKEISDLLRLQESELKSILSARVPLPIARASTLDEAALVEEKLKPFGMKLLVVKDEELAVDEEIPKRLRTVEFKEDALHAHPTSGAQSFALQWDEIVLLVTGRLYTRRVEVEERRGRRSAENEIREAREFTWDEAVVDIYSKGAEPTARIAANNFDFSCLGERKSLTAAENFARLVDELRARAHGARFDETYNRVRHALAPVWPTDQHTDALGLRREIGRLSTEAATTDSNETQFTRYSRLRRYLLNHRPDTFSL